MPCGCLSRSLSQLFGIRPGHETRDGFYSTLLYFTVFTWRYIGMCKGGEMGPARGVAEKNKPEYLFRALPVFSYFLCLTSTPPSP